MPIFLLTNHQTFDAAAPNTEEDYDAFCLAYMFTYRDFEMGTLGLAWTGDLKNAGGVCEKNGVRPLINYNTPHMRFFISTSCCCAVGYLVERRECGCNVYLIK